MDELVKFPGRVIPQTDVFFLVPVASSSTPANAYVAEDGSTFYVAEDGSTYYVQEQ